MTTENSVTGWLNALQVGDKEAVPQLWQRYFHRLVGLARQKMRDVPRRVADEEDIALSVFDSFCRRAEQGQFQKLFDRENLWQLLATITARKVFGLLRDQRRQKRGGGAAGQGELIDLEEVLGKEPGPDQVFQVEEEYRRLLNLLPEEELRLVAMWKMEGYTTEEIASRLGCAPRSVKRKVQLIRTIWERETES